MGVSLTLQRVSPPSGSRQWVQGRCSRWRPWRGRSWWSPGAQAGEPGCSCWSTHTETCGTGGIRRPNALGSGDWEQKWGLEVLGLSRDGSPLQVPPQAVSSWHLAGARAQWDAIPTLAHLSANSLGSCRKAWQSSSSEGWRYWGSGWGGCRRAARHSFRSSPSWAQHSVVPGCAGKGESALQDLTDRAVDCGRERRLWPPHPVPAPVWGPLPIFGQPHPGIVAGGVSPVGTAGLGQGDDFPDEVADLLEGAIGIFPAVGNDGPGSREQGQGEPGEPFSSIKNHVTALFCPNGV